MTRAVFGQREARVFTLTHDRVLKDHEEYRNGHVRTRRNRQGRFRRMLGWISFCTIGSAATLAFASERVIPVVQEMGRALPL